MSALGIARGKSVNRVVDLYLSTEGSNKEVGRLRAHTRLTNIVGSIANEIKSAFSKKTTKKVGNIPSRSVIFIEGTERLARRMR